MCSTPAELAKAGRRAIAVRPEDVDGLIKVNRLVLLGGGTKGGYGWVCGSDVRSAQSAQVRCKKSFDSYTLVETMVGTFSIISFIRRSSSFHYFYYCFCCPPASADICVQKNSHSSVRRLCAVIFGRIMLYKKTALNPEGGWGTALPSFTPWKERPEHRCHKQKGPMYVVHVYPKYASV